MNLAKAPRSVILVLALMAVVSFGVGLWLEFFRGDWLQNHPYLSDLLSGVTGFSTSALVAVVALNAVIRRARVKQWSVEMARSLQDAAHGATRIANAVRSLVGEPRFGDADSMRTDPLIGLKQVADDIRSRGPRVGQLTDVQADEWRTLLRRVGRFTSLVMPRIVTAFDCHENPQIVGPWRTIESDVALLTQAQDHRGYAGQRETVIARRMCHALVTLLDAIAQSPVIADNYRMALRDLPPEPRTAET
ncbi:MAG: hypothetical protein IRY85_12220 [Micromonosporaceae bacterium]|nr:hypothetical protein [Micromonosporaceae bacterium]